MVTDQGTLWPDPGQAADKEGSMIQQNADLEILAIAYFLLVLLAGLI